MITRVHVNQHVLKANRKHGTTDPVLTVKDYKQNRYCNSVELPDGCRVVHSPDKPLSCGAVLWVETEGRVIINDQGQDNVEM